MQCWQLLRRKGGTRAGQVHVELTTATGQDILMSDTPKTLAVGIDLGTTHSVVAHLDAQGRPWTVNSAEGDTTTPSVVFFDRDAIIVGKEAVKAAAFEPELVAQYAKRDVGRVEAHRSIRGEQVPPEVVQALVLCKLRDDAQQKLGPIHDVVITVPAYYNEPRRKATQDAGRLASLNVLDIINEPTAAAIAFGVQRGFLSSTGAATMSEVLLVYDLGGGTFDVTVMEMNGHNYKALATAGDVYLGGIDWDLRLADYLAEQILAQTGSDPREDASAHQRLLREVEDAKHALSARTEATIHFEHAGQRCRLSVSREQFEALTTDLVERTAFTTRKVLQDAKLDWDSVTRLLLVGGSTRMPMIESMLQHESGLVPDRSLAPDEAVAHGAAIYASMLRGREPAMQLTNVNSHDLGVLAIEGATGRPRRQLMIARNTPLPTMRKVRFATHENNQTSVSVNVIEGGDASGSHATSIGMCIVSDLPPELPAKTPIDVEFCYAKDGRLTVHAHLPDTGQAADLVIERSTGLDNTLLKLWEHRFRDGLKIGTTDAQPAPAAKSPKPEPPATKTTKKPPPPAPKKQPVAEPKVEDPDLDSFLQGFE